MERGGERFVKMSIPFVKMHGLGNDYIYLDEREAEIPDPGPWAPILCDRHRGIGADGIIVLRRDDELPVRMEMVNADGSRSAMCGNGIRCVARLARERGYATEDAFEIGIDGGRCAARIVRSFLECGFLPDDRIEDAPITGAAINLGLPEIGPSEVIEGIFGSLEGRAVDVGNPHFVHQLTDGALADYPLSVIGPAVEHHERFPHRTNLGIASVERRDFVKLRVWERGSGETQACGSGATAAVSALRAAGQVDDSVTVHVLGGRLEIDFDAYGHAWMTGDAEHAFTGSFDEGPLAETFPKASKKTRTN